MKLKKISLILLLAVATVSHAQQAPNQQEQGERAPMPGDDSYEAHMVGVGVGGAMNHNSNGEASVAMPFSIRQYNFVTQPSVNNDRVLVFSADVQASAGPNWVTPPSGGAPSTINNLMLAGQGSVGVGQAFTRHIVAPYVGGSGFPGSIRLAGNLDRASGNTLTPLNSNAAMVSRRVTGGEFLADAGALVTLPNGRILVTPQVGLLIANGLYRDHYADPRTDGMPGSLGTSVVFGGRAMISLTPRFIGLLQVLHARAFDGSLVTTDIRANIAAMLNQWLGIYANADVGIAQVNDRSGGSTREVDSRVEMGFMVGSAFGGGNSPSRNVPQPQAQQAR